MSPLATLSLAFLLTGPAPSPGRPTLAVEDTMHTEVPEVLVEAPRVTLDEILDRVAAGEARRESLLIDQTFQATFRIVHNTVGAKTPEVLREIVARVYKKKPDKVRGVVIRDWELKPDKKKDDDDTPTFSPSMGEQIVNFAFRADGRRDFKFRIVGRDLLGDHLVYRIAFEPRSLLEDFQPSGTVWVDTNDFVIVRQEIAFPRSPIPLFIRSIDRLVVERRRIDTYWVLKRVLMRIQMTVPMPKIGRSFDMAIAYDDYTINSGLTDAVFDTKKGPADWGTE